MVNSLAIYNLYILRVHFFLYLYRYVLVLTYWYITYWYTYRYMDINPLCATKMVVEVGAGTITGTGTQDRV